MIKPVKRIYSVYVIIDAVILAASFYVPYLCRYNSWDQFPHALVFPHLKEYTYVFLLWSALIIVSLNRKLLYATDRGLSIPREIVRVTGTILYSSVFVGCFIFFLQFRLFSRLVFFENIFCLCLFLNGWRVIKRLILRHMIAKGFHNINVLIVGAGKVGTIIVDAIKSSPWWGLRPVGFLDDRVNLPVAGVPVLGRLDDFFNIAKKSFIDEVIITIPSERQAVSRLIQEARRLNLGVRIVPENFDLPPLDMQISSLGFMPLLTYQERRHHPGELAAKRLFDFCVSAIALIMLLPFFAVIAALVKLDSKGPVFFRQKRVGYKGKIFNCYKFRSMVDGAERMKPELLHKNEVKDGYMFKIRQDPRLTRIGRFLRRYSIDELPQFFNVLKGDMSLVGTRPPTVDEVELYNPFQMERLSIRPGITGLAQIRGRSELHFRQWVRWDLWYIHNWSFYLDLSILFATLPVVSQKKGAY